MTGSLSPESGDASGLIDRSISNARPVTEERALPSPRKSPRSNTGTSHAFRADLEGMRGVAVLLVVLYHCGISAVQGGFVGVDVFFVLSGYLITGLLVLEMERTQHLDFWRFYARRARRLLPAATLVLLVTLMASAIVFSPLELAEVARSARATAAYLSNVRFMLGATDYFAAGSAPNPLLHTWSLAVEEQFYFVWPLLLWIGMRRSTSRRRLILLMLGVSIVSFVGCVWLTRIRQPWAFFASPARAWEFGVGAMAGLIPAATLRANERFSKVAGWTGLSAVVVAATVFSETTAFPGAVALLPVLGAAAIMVAGVGAPGAGVGRLLNTFPLQYLGRLSYSWYLWHWPVLILATAWFGELSFAGALLAAALSLALSHVAYRFVENPIRFHSRLASAPPSRTLVLAVAVTAGSIMVAGVFHSIAQRDAEDSRYRRFARAADDLPRLYTDGCMVAIGAATPIECTYGDPQSAKVVVGFGDSHMAQWFPALDSLAGERNWRLVIFIKSSCPSTALGLPIFNDPLKRVESECASWRDRVIARVRVLRPDLVVLSNSIGYVNLPGEHESRPRLSLEQWRNGTRRTLEALRESGAAVVVLRDPPRPEINIPRCLARAEHRLGGKEDTCNLDRDRVLHPEVYRAEADAVAMVAGTGAVDLSAAFCDAVHCPASRNGVIIYRDGNHVTTDYARSLTGALAVALDSTLRRIGSPSLAP